MAQTPAQTPVIINDPHSYAKPAKAVITHLDLDIQVDFDKHQISGTASYDIVQQSGASEIVFDVLNLNIHTVLADGKKVGFSIDEGTPWGNALRVSIPENTSRVEISYNTSPAAAALQWLTPQQTGGKKHPFLFTQGEAILTRTWIPIQDSPGIRITYKARVAVPKGLMAVMSASNPQKMAGDGVYHFEMPQPIPPYLIAMAVGELAYKPVSKRTGVYAEPSMVEKAAWEFADMDKMVQTAEELYGKYRWDQFDVLVLPPSFPFGGMENPRLTFATPTVVAGDRSLTSLVAHELAHSWSGNLVTNATWNDFWLNEGFTVYFEHRIMEKLYGKDYEEMLGVLGRQDLIKTIHDLGETSADTHLKLNLAGRDADDGMNLIAYEKGFAFLKLLENKAGREVFDHFVRKYFEDHAFRSMTTELFVIYLKDNLIEPQGLKVDIDKWIYGPGLPAEAPAVHSDRFDLVDKGLKSWLDGEITPQDLPTQKWSTHEWLHFIRLLPSDISLLRMETLDKSFGLTQSGNAEIQAAWYELALHRGYETAYKAVEEFLMSVGRRKFLIPLYKAMINGPVGKEFAVKVYQKARGNYHAVSTGTIDKMLEYKG